MCAVQEKKERQTWGNRRTSGGYRLRTLFPKKCKKMQRRKQEKKVNVKKTEAAIYDFFSLFLTQNLLVRNRQKVIQGDQVCLFYCFAAGRQGFQMRLGVREAMFVWF